MAFLLKNYLKLSLSKQFLQLQQRNLTISRVIFKPHKENPNTAPQNESNSTSNTQKKRESIKITLFQNENMAVIALEEAKNLAKRRSMHLVKIQDMDSKTQRPVYKLLTAAELLQNELAELKKTDKGDKSAAAQKKTEKILNIGSRIGDHDLQSRLKNISKWLDKQHEVRILIQGNSEQDLGNCEKIFKTIEEFIKTPQVIGKIVQKRNKDLKSPDSFTLRTTTIRCYTKLYKQQYPQDERLLSSSATNSTLSSTYKGPLALTCLGIFCITVKYFFWWNYLQPQPQNVNVQSDTNVSTEEGSFY